MKYLGQELSAAETMALVEDTNVDVCRVRSAVELSNQQKQRLEALLREKLGLEIEPEYIVDKYLIVGMRVRIGDLVIDNSFRHNLEVLREHLRSLEIMSESKDDQELWANNELGYNENKVGDLLPTQDLITELNKIISDYDPHMQLLRVGHVLTISDGVAFVDGLSDCMYNELVIFPNGVYGMVMNLETDRVGVVIMGDYTHISQGDEVVRSGRLLQVPVGEALLGRVVTAIGFPIDGRGVVEAEDFRPVENSAPAILDRKPVTTPLATGILAIDSMVPIGRGQRELIIGDRQTGKTTICIDTILNQKDKNVICIYVAIGQKEASVRSIVQQLTQAGAMNYTVVVAALAGDPTPMQYIAPYAGCAMGEYFMHQGKDVLIVYDDLTKQAVAYREISLLLKRPPGREAYPGDVFYLHSRLLERAAQLSDEKGGGSLTALPIIETQYGDVSSYIPTNVISITDGQIFLEADLFHSGQRPAVNAGISVSRVGGHAQIKAMKRVAGRLRIDLAQYRELEAFTQFGAEIDDDTKERLKQGSVMMELLKQPPASPLSFAQQVLLIYASLNGFLNELPVEEVSRFKNTLLAYLDHAGPKSIVARFNDDKDLTKEERQVLDKFLQDYVKQYMEQRMFAEL